MKRLKFDLTTTSGKLFHWALVSLPRKTKVKWDMGQWYGSVYNKNDEPCGTAACAAGHLGLDPAFRRLGFKACRLGNYVSLGGEDTFCTGSDAVALVMGIDPQEAQNIVRVGAYDGADYKKDGTGIKKSAVKRRIIALAREYQARGL